MKLAATSEAAVLCAITVTSVAIWEEERVKTSACPLFQSHTHTHAHSVFVSLPIQATATALALLLRFIALNLNTPG